LNIVESSVTKYGKGRDGRYTNDAEPQMQAPVDLFFDEPFRTTPGRPVRRTAIFLRAGQGETLLRSVHEPANKLQAEPAASAVREQDQRVERKAVRKFFKEAVFWTVFQVRIVLFTSLAAMHRLACLF
jgi:hypothetical protein